MQTELSAQNPAMEKANKDSSTKEQTIKKISSLTQRKIDLEANDRSDVYPARGKIEGHAERLVDMSIAMILLTEIKVPEPLVPAAQDLRGCIMKYQEQENGPDRGSLLQQLRASKAKFDIALEKYNTDNRVTLNEEAMNPSANHPEIAVPTATQTPSPATVTQAPSPEQELHGMCLDLLKDHGDQELQITLLKAENKSLREEVEALKKNSR
ncbi:MAG: hypothetical protein Q9187_003988 [Circinaria calcarea]